MRQVTSPRKLFSKSQFDSRMSVAVAVVAAEQLRRETQLHLMCFVTVNANIKRDTTS